MSDQLLFVVTPYIAAALFVLVCTGRCMFWRQSDRSTAGPSSGDGRSLVVAATRSAFAVIAGQHLVAFAAPHDVLLWNQQLRRLLVLEAAGMGAGSVALAGFLALRLRQLRTPRASVDSPADVVAGTLVFMSTMSGVAVALTYRWASSWSAVTVVPYLHSLVQLQPSTTVVARLPFLVRLHVFGAFVLLAIAPLSRIGRYAPLAIDRVLQWILAPSSSLARRAWHVIGVRSAAPVRAAYASLLRNDHEEN
jgi:nitrate reductase gamma subunit